jgi:hypothetical protein
MQGRRESRWRTAGHKERSVEALPACGPPAWRMIRHTFFLFPFVLFRTTGICHEL